MKHTLLFIFIFGCITATAQSRLNFEVGMTNTIFAQGGEHPQDYYKHSSNTSPTAHLTYMYKADKHVYFGVGVGVEHYSFFFAKATDTAVSSITHKSTYLDVLPVVDFGLGRHQYVHFYFDLSLNFMLAGQQTTGSDFNHSIPIGSEEAAATNAATDDQINRFVFRFGAGFKQHIPISRLWHITFNEGIQFMPTDLTRNGTLGGVHPGMIMFQMGVMRKLHNPARPSAN